ncbi:MAG: tRNA (adenosine(37)-N6)-threonylcarbamoyltransferase complex transferase subunit TsaD [Dehalococcoidia bacterium]
MLVLGIETSCDETAASVVEDGTQAHSNIISSQVEIHARYGGVVPEVASRQHILQIIPVVQLALKQARASWQDLDGIAVTIGPGLAGSLLVGVNMAKALALAHRLPLVGVNHLEGHVYANWLREDGGPDQSPDFPCLCLIASGGHTDLVLMEDHGRYTLLGRTRDDAAGEAFDKVARVLGLGYPGGPAIERAAHSGSNPCSFPRAWLKGTDDFSFSGLKTAVIRVAADLGVVDSGDGTPLDPSRPPAPVADIAAGFQEAVVDVLVEKTSAVARRDGVRQVLLSGGVAANDTLRRAMTRRSPVPVRCPRPALCTDNAAMIAACGYYHLLRGQRAAWDLDVYPNLPMAHPVCTQASP